MIFKYNGSENPAKDKKNDSLADEKFIHDI
jgi:hypothetical protein